MPEISPPCNIATPRVAFPSITPPYGSLFALFVILSVWPATTLAEVRVVTAQGEHRLGDRDTREDAIRLATEAAKRNALEQVATYLESVTIVDGLDVTKDEIRTYTAGLVLVLEQNTNTMLDGDTVVVKTDLVAQVDTEEVGHAIAALRENEDARHQLVALKQENDQLQQDLETANQALAKASTAEQVQQAAQQRQDILNQVQSNAMVSQAWTDWVLVSPAVYPYPWVGLAQAQALLNVARSLYPTSRHVQVAQQVITTRQPPAPPPQPRSGPVPLTLNEITPATTTAPPQIGNQLQPGQVVPSHGAPPNLRSAHAFQQFIPHQSPAGQPPMTRRLPPTINQIHPPTLHQVPRVPYQIAPRAQGGGGRNGGGHGGGGGRGRGR